MSNVMLINLSTGDIIEADIYKLMDRGMPEGYKPVEEIPQKKWAKKYSELKKELGGTSKRTIGTIVDEVIEVIQEQSSYNGESDFMTSSALMYVGSQAWEEKILPELEDIYGIDTDPIIGLDFKLDMGLFIIKIANYIFEQLQQ